MNRGLPEKGRIVLALINVAGCGTIPVCGQFIHDGLGFSTLDARASYHPSDIVDWRYLKIFPQYSDRYNHNEVAFDNWNDEEEE